MTPKQLVRRFLESGDHDLLHETWPGQDIVEKGCKAERAMKDALVKEVRRRVKDRECP